VQVEQPRPGGKGKTKLVSQPVQQWLRWTHEATVINVERMADGRDYVLTFETGQIGVILRPLSSLVNTWDVFVGYLPPASIEPPGLEAMIDRKSILPPSADVEFGLPAEEVEEQVSEEQLERIRAERAAALRRVELWASLTPRQRQVVALICQGMSVREVATRLDTSTGNIRSHLSRAMGKFGVHAQPDLCHALSGLDVSLWVDSP
jgi:RNA polymerase sigma factor (sigma-70 family)